MNKYVNLALSALAAALITGSTVAATTHDVWPIAVAALGALGTAIVQHMRTLPREEWTDEERAAKLKETPK